jgi:hypothetical protein
MRRDKGEMERLLIGVWRATMVEDGLEAILVYIEKIEVLRQVPTCYIRVIEGDPYTFGHIDTLWKSILPVRPNVEFQCGIWHWKHRGHGSAVWWEIDGGAEIQMQAFMIERLEG